MSQTNRKKLGGPSLSTPSLPHSWRLRDWPRDIAPGSTQSARNLIRQHQQVLQNFGALSRVGRDLIILGQGYAAFLASGMNRVDNFESTKAATAARKAG